MSIANEPPVGLVPLEKGEWMLHCRIQEHAEAGMMTLVDVPPQAAERADGTPALTGHARSLQSRP